MTPVMKADYQQTDSRYPIVVTGPTDWNKMSVQEAKDFVGELLTAIETAERYERMAA